MSSTNDIIIIKSNNINIVSGCHPLTILLLLSLIILILLVDVIH